MAGIDKTYVHTLDEYKEVTEWMKNFVHVLPNGTVLRGEDFVYERECPEELFPSEHGIPVMNTSNAMDYFLIRECPVELVQNRMKEVYNEDFYISVKNGTSKYDKFVRPEGGHHLKLTRKPGRDYHPKWFNKYTDKWVKDRFSINVTFPDGTWGWYLEDYDYWPMPDELAHGQSCSHAHLKVNSIKALKRRVLKWNLPVGTRVKFSGFYYTGMEGEFLVTK